MLLLLQTLHLLHSLLPQGQCIRLRIQSHMRGSAPQPQIGAAAARAVLLPQQQALQQQLRETSHWPHQLLHFQLQRRQGKRRAPQQMAATTG